MFSYPAACDLDEDLLELVTMVLVAAEDDRSCRLRPVDRARCTLVHLCKHDTLEQLAAGFAIGTATAWRYVNHTIGQLARFAPSLTEALTSHHANGYALLDGTVAETDRVAATGHFSGKVRREGVNLQVITAEEGRLLWLSPALPGSTHDVKATREHGIIDICTQLHLEILADQGYQGAGGTVITPIKRCPQTELPYKHKRSNTVHAALRTPVERTTSRIKQRRIFRHAPSARTDLRQSPPRSSPS
ncbi:transposase [Streptomyces sp. NBRC 110611]|nr:transposase [Streptomyces sp. NBRC 110611]